MECKIIIFAFGFLAALAEGADWDYSVAHGPSKWGETYPNCNGKSQSPINIITANAKIDKNLPIVPRSHFYAKPTKMTLSNNGHTLVMMPTEDAYTISDKKLLPFNAKLAQYHFHWGTASTSGSEHELNSKQYFGELHAVHYNTKYSDLTEALPKSDGLAVFGWFISATYPQTNQDMEYLLNIAKMDASDKDDTVVVEPTFSLETILPPDLDVYYRYKGSLTTPTCDESVVWTVFESPIEITVDQAKFLSSNFFENKTENTLLINNFRPVQDLNNRAITKPAPLEQRSGTNVARPSTIVGLVTCALVYFF